MDVFKRQQDAETLRFVETVLGLKLWERGANEVFLLHGTSVTDAKQIEVQGFDDRLCQRMLYGRGVYLTTEA
jgi:catechol 2,3-dioxygenase-like lactoylglutathione lyase family enzyme